MDAWRRGEQPGRLTWKSLEDASGFTRQALASKPQIAEAYGIAKGASRGDVRRVHAPKPEAQLVDDLRREIDQLKGIVMRYDDRWMRWTRNAAQLGYDIERLDEHLDPPARAFVRVVRSKMSQSR